MRNLVGQVFGHLKVIEELENNRIICYCDLCKKEKEFGKYDVSSGNSTSCGCQKSFIDKTGQTFGYLTITKELRKGRVLCVCNGDCGGIEKEYDKHRVISYMVGSCGCMRYKSKTLPTDFKSHLHLSKNQTISIVGNRYERLTVLEELGYNKILCRCDCKEGVSNIRVYSKSSVCRGTTKSCGCYVHDINIERGNITALKAAEDNFTGAKLITYQWLRGFLHGAKINDHKVEVTPIDLENKFLQQNGKCALSGLQINLPKTGAETRKGLYNASVDRIISSLHYFLHNIQWTSREINFMKSDFPQDQFLEYCRLVAEYNKLNHLEILLKCPEDCSAFCLNNIQKTGSAIIVKEFWDSIGTNAKSRNLKVEITSKDIEIQYLKQQGKCALTGVLITLPKTREEYRKYEHTSSVDRINSDLDYTLDNIQILHKDINNMKWDHSQNYFIDLCKTITNHQKSLNKTN